MKRSLAIGALALITSAASADTVSHADSFDAFDAFMPYGTANLDSNITNRFFASPFTTEAAHSQNLGFPFQGVDLPVALDNSGYITFDADATGEYDAEFTLQDPADAFLSDDGPTIVKTVPAPGSFALLGLGGLVATRRRR